jgi:hypothetical protein
MRATNSIPLERPQPLTVRTFYAVTTPLPLTVRTIYDVTTLKAWGRVFRLSLVPAFLHEGPAKHCDIESVDGAGPQPDTQA